MLMYHTGQRSTAILVSVTCLFLAGIAAAGGAPSWLEGYESRRDILLNQYAAGGSADLYNDLARLALGMDPSGAGIDNAIGMLNARQDTADFKLPGLMRLLYRHAGDPLLSADVKNRTRQAILAFKYWPDEPGADSMCTWTENHQILFSAGAYLAGQLYPDEIFTNSGRTGAQMMAVHKPRILRWLDLRYRTGFSEWLSNVYYNEDLPPLLALADFAQDADLAQRAKMVIDLLLLDMALNSHRGIFGSTHGRSYENSKKWPQNESTSDIEWLMFDQATLHYGNMSATCFALSESYLMPEVIYEIANDTERLENITRQRMGLRIAPDNAGGLSFDLHNYEDGMVWLSLEAYCHPLVFPTFVEMLDAYNWWGNDFFAPFETFRPLIELWRDEGTLSVEIAKFEYDLTRNVRDEVNIYTYRTPDYMLSSAQNYRPGYGGDQHSIWQATLGGNAVCFTTHPAQYAGDTPNYWTGAGWLPKVGQYKNVAIILHDASDEGRGGLYFPVTLDFTHAWLPREEFDEVVEQDGWVFARHDNAYLALRSQNPYFWQLDAAGDPYMEMVVPGRKNVYICELGRPETHGTFGQFVQSVSNADLAFGTLAVAYRSPSQGALGFSWNGALMRNGSPVSVSGYGRYDTPYGSASFPANAIQVEYNGHRLSLDWQDQTRETGPVAVPAAAPAALCLVAAALAASAIRRLKTSVALRLCKEGENEPATLQR
ncbi:MAG: hypothetical protein NTZ09_10545 [Candidatus Hydrogenedentes bacterium]|nr:hypothetical protein [Candidatus Hydrogenedentota bacterium]